MLQLEDDKRAIVNPYKSLKDISEVRPFDPERDAQLFDDLRKVLEAHDAVDRFGVTLLHDHFPLADGEVLIETHNTKTRTLTIKPYRNPELKEGESLQETNWRFQNGQIQALSQCINTPIGHIGNE